MSKILRVALLLDNSGSMRGIMSKAIDQTNTWLKSFESTPDDTIQVSVYGFSTHLRLLRSLNDPSKIKPIRSSEANDFGLTALYSSIDQVITDLQAVPSAESDEVSYLVMVVTDGRDEPPAGKRFEPSRLAYRIGLLQEQDNWTFAFAAPSTYEKRSIIANLNLYDDNVTVWSATDQGVEDLGIQTVSAIGSYLDARAKGATRSATFYANAAPIKVDADLKPMDPLSYRILSVLKDTSIQAFVEENGLTFYKGCGYYELKGRASVDVQDYKDLIVVDNAKPDRLYSGSNVRQLLNLPTSGTIKLRAGNVGNNTVFVRSTSNNRKLRAGSRFVYLVK